jgi:hypothetical protein
MVSENQTRSPRESILVDGHVHIHRCFDLQALFESAQQNFCDAASTLNLGSRFSAVLLLTESQGVDYFSSFLRKATDRSSVGGWRFQPTTEPDSLIAVSRAGFELTLIAGRQIATAERLEVLAVCTDKLFDDGGTIPVVIDSVSAANGVAIVPWGFGKWTGRRKNVINRLMGDFAKRPFHLGDNSGRISVWREPPQFDLAKSQGQRIFRGTDPIPFPGQENRVGSFGFSISGPFNRSGPTASMRNLLASGNIQPTPYGVLETPMVFAKNQLKMQVRKLQRQMKSDPT